jgi:hypothetical protein
MKTRTREAAVEVSGPVRVCCGPKRYWSSGVVWWSMVSKSDCKHLTGRKTRCMCGQVGYWSNSSSSHCNSTETRSTRRNWKPQAALHSPRRSTAYSTGAGMAGPLAMLHNTPPYALFSTTRVYRGHATPHRAHRRGDAMPPRRSTAHPTDAHGETAAHPTDAGTAPAIPRHIPSHASLPLRSL